MHAAIALTAPLALFALLLAPVSTQAPVSLLAPTSALAPTDDEAWVPEIPEGLDPIGAIDTSAGERGIVPLPKTVDRRLRRVFDRYTKVVAPSGEPIHVLAQSGWSDDQIVRVRLVLEHLLTDVPDVEFGDKTPVANAMAARRATMVLFDDVDAMEAAFDGAMGDIELGFQDLRANECPVEGDADWLAHRTRDAAFEEILHLVHDYGLRLAYPQLDARIELASLAAVKAGTWDPWPRDEPENWRNEYVAAAYDDWLDLWAVDPTHYEGERLEADELPEGTSHFGAFGADSRERLQRVDPAAVAVIEAFLPDHLTYVAELPVTFTGTFEIAGEAMGRAQAKSTHLRHLRLRGDLDANLVGDEHANRLFGNAGANRLRGLAGDDVLDGGTGDDAVDGGAGHDVAVFRGRSTQYEVTHDDGGWIVEGPDGRDRVTDCEILRFDDKDFEVER